MKCDSQFHLSVCTVSLTASRDLGLDLALDTKVVLGLKLKVGERKGDGAHPYWKFENRR